MRNRLLKHKWRLLAWLIVLTATSGQACGAAAVAVKDSATTTKNTAKIVNVLVNDTGKVATTTVTTFSNPPHGTVNKVGQDLKYQPDTGYVGPDSFTYTITGNSTATVSMKVTGTPDPITYSLGSTANVDEGKDVTLAATNVKGGKWPLSYSWAVTAGTANLEIVSKTGASVKVRGKEVSKNESAKVTLTVKDSSSPKLSVSKSVTVTVKNINTAVIASITGAGDFNEGATKTLTAKVTAGKSPFTYKWAVTSGAAAVEIVGGTTGSSLKLKGKDVAANTPVTVKLTVTDSANPKQTTTSPVTATMKVLNVNAGLAATIGGVGNFNEGTTKTLTANVSSGKSPYTYNWIVTSGAGAVEIVGGTKGSSFKLKGKDVAANTTVTVQLTVTDSANPKQNTVKTASMKVLNVTSVIAASIIGAVDFNEGSSRILKANVTSGKRPFTYKWEITQGASAVEVVGGTTNQTLELKGKEVAAKTLVAVKVTIIDSAVPKQSIVKTDSLNVLNVVKLPVANAGPDKTVNEGTSIELDGSASVAKEVGAVIKTYAWKSLDDPNILLGNSAKPIFTTPRVGKAGKVLHFSLQVTDDKGQKSNIATVKITVANSVNAAPVAVIKESADSVKPGADFTLDGSGSTDLDGKSTIASYKWTQDPKDSLRVTIVDGNAAVGKFKAPAINATAQVTLILTVTDEEDKKGTAQAVIVITLDATLKKPIANAGADISVDVNKPVTLDGSGSKDANPDGSIVSYQWTQVKGTPVTLTDADKAKASFTSPASVPGGFEALEFQLKVVDNDSLFDTDKVLVNVGPNDLPVVNAGKDQLDILEGSTVTLSGTASDKDGTIEKVEWRQVGGKPEQQVIFSDPAANNVTFVTPAVTGGLDALELVLEFRAFDNLGGIGSDRVKVVVKDNGITTIPDGFVPVRAANEAEDPIGFDIDSGKLVALSPKKLEFNNGDQKNRPRSIPYGLFNFTLSVMKKDGTFDKDGGSATLRVKFPENVSSGFGWFKYDAKTKTWSSYPNVKFEGDTALITLKDGGVGDEDGKINGFIYDPSGLGSVIPKNKTKIEGSSGGGALGGSLALMVVLGGALRRRRSLEKQ